MCYLSIAKERWKCEGDEGEGDGMVWRRVNKIEILW